MGRRKGGSLATSNRGVHPSYAINNLTVIGNKLLFVAPNGIDADDPARKPNFSQSP